MATVKSWEADVPSVSPLSEWLEELWVVIICRNGAILLVGIRWRENKNKLVEWKVLIDTVGIEGAYLENKLLF